MASKNSVQVAIKVRPLLKREKELIPFWRVVNNSIQLSDSHSEPFYFDHIFDENDSNQIVFDKMAKQIVHSSVQGFNGTIFAYGQTSSGKTYTMMGDEENPGVMVLAAKEIFKEIERATDRQFVLRVGYIEIYNEKIFDLLNKRNQDLKIHEAGTGIVSVNCEEFIITCEEDLLQYLSIGNKGRTVGETNMNERSSRSHAIFRIIVESRKMDKNEDDTITQSVLNLVDLAGSERADQTGARGTRLKEGGHINKSLLFLSNVIKRLSENEDDKYISYRDSKLTRILQASLGGNALTSIICTIKPTAIEETQSTLNFAMRAKIIKNKPRVNEIVSDSTMMKRLEREIKELKNCLEEERLKNQSQSKVGQLEQRIKNEVLKIISSTSLHSIRTQRERRRRTWCPATSNIPSSLPLPKITEGATVSSIRMQQSKNYLTPLITCRNLPETNGNTNGSRRNSDCDLREEGEDQFDAFVPGEKFDLQMQTPEVSPNHTQGIVILTPSSNKNITTKLRYIEQEFKELQEFTHLENKIDVQHESYSALKQQVEELAKRNLELENERIEFMQHKLENAQNVSLFEKRCTDYVKQIDELTVLNREAAERIIHYERELAELRSRMQQLEVENREAISLEFEFERHKNKFKLRETELLEVLAEKDQEIIKLEKSLQTITDDNYQMHAKDKSNQHTSATARDERAVGSAATSGCMKCKDLERLLEENSKMKLDFETLTLEYKQLQSSYQQVITDATAAQDIILKLQRASARQAANDEEADKLRIEIVGMKEKLENVLQDHKRLNSDSKIQTEECQELNRIVLTAKEELRLLQDKYNKLETLYLNQQEMISQIQSEYGAIELKYLDLQKKYDELESTSTQSLEECARLQQENIKLQAEIIELKGKVEQAQKNLMEGSMKEDPAEDTGIRARIECDELAKLQAQLIEMQKENDDLSNQLMDSLEDGEQLRNEFAKLESQMKKLQAREQSSDEQQMIRIKSEDDEKSSIKTEPSEINDWGSIRSSGLGMDEVKEEYSTPPKFMELIDVLEEIELAYRNGSSRIFTARYPTETNKTVSTPLKMRLSSLQGIVLETDNITELESRGVYMQGTLKQSKFSIVDSGEFGAISYSGESVADHVRRIEVLERQHDKLEQKNNMLICENKNIIETTEGTIADLREQIDRLSNELLEKTLSIEKCSCEDYQKQIENLKMNCQELLTKYSELEESFKKDQSMAASPSTNEVKDPNETISGEEISNDRSAEIENLKFIQSELNRRIVELEAELEEQRANLMSQIELVEQLRQQKHELDQRCLAAEANLKELRTEHEEQSANAQQKIDDLIERMRSKENDCKRLELELVGKLDAIEDEYRVNMRKYNREWQDSKENYERQIKEMENELETLKSVCKCKSLKCQLEEKENEIAELAMKLDHCQKELANNRLCATDIDKLQETITQLLADQTKWHEEKAQLLGEKEQLQHENKQLLVDHDNLQSKYDKFAFDRTKLEETLYKLEQRMSANDASMLSLNEENEKLASTLSVLQCECNTIRKEFNAILKEKETISMQRDELEQDTESLQEELDQLTETCDTLRKEADALNREYKILISERNQLKNKLKYYEGDQQSTNELDAQQKKRFQVLQTQVEVLGAENKELKESINALKISLAAVEVEKEQLLQQIDNLKMIQAEELVKMKEEKSDCDRLIQKMQMQVSELEDIVKDNTIVKDAMEKLKLKYEQTLNELQFKKNELLAVMDAKKQLEKETNEQIETLKQKEADLIEEVKNVRDQALFLEKKLKEHDKLVANLSKVLNQGFSMEQIIDKMVAVDWNAPGMADLQEELRTTMDERIKMQERQRRLEAQLSALRDEVRLERVSMQRQQKEMESAVHEWRMKYDLIDEANKELEKKNLEIKKKLENVNALDNADKLHAELRELRQKYQELQSRIESSSSVSSSKVYELETELVQQKKLLTSKSDANLTLRALMLKKESKFNEDKERLEGTISCLLGEKKNLEEQLHSAQSTIIKLKSEILTINANCNVHQRRSDNDNPLTESHSSPSPRARKSLNRLSIEGQAKSLISPLEEKIIEMPSKTQRMDLERKNRRISTHDERRRHSFWGDTREVGCMTDPTDRNCNCIELDKKLKENERTLYICQSQVAVLNMELKNNPLKIENAELKKRLQEEQLKASTEIQRYKEIIVEQRMKTVAQSNSMLQQQQQQEKANEKSKRIPITETACQTESKLEEQYRKLESKYMDLKNVCRYRYNLIQSLEKKINEKENAHDNVPSSVELGQIKALKSQIETYKNDLRVYKQKYEDAKTVLELRRVEIKKLKSELNTANDDQ